MTHLPAFHPGNFLTRNMNSTNTGLMYGRTVYMQLLIGMKDLKAGAAGLIQSCDQDGEMVVCDFELNPYFGSRQYMLSVVACNIPQIIHYKLNKMFSRSYTPTSLVEASQQSHSYTSMCAFHNVSNKPPITTDLTIYHYHHILEF